MILTNYLNHFAEISQDKINIPTTSLGSDNLRHGLQIFLGICAAVAMLIIAVSAFRYVISRGDSNAVKKAKESIIYASVGLVITMSAYGIVTFVVTRL